MIRVLSGIAAFIGAALPVALGGFVILQVIRKREPGWSDAETIADLEVNEAVSLTIADPPRKINKLGYYAAGGSGRSPGAGFLPSLPWCRSSWWAPGARFWRRNGGRKRVVPRHGP
jgi:hypothetical protein